MQFEHRLEEFRRRFPDRGTFCFRPGDFIRRVVADNGVRAVAAVTSLLGNRLLPF